MNPLSKGVIIRYVVPALAWLLVLSSPARAQTTLFPIDLPAIEFAPRFYFLPLSGSYHADLLYTRLASPDELDPGAGSSGRVETLLLAAGVRSVDLKTFDFRWRAGLIEMDLVRTPLSIGLTLFDFNRTGWMDTDFRWVNLRLGPSLLIRSSRFFFSLRAIGSAGLTTVKIGSFLYDGLGPEILARRRSYELGYAGDLHVMLWERISIQALFSYRTMLGGGRPQFYRLSGAVGGRLTPTVSIHLMYTVEDANIGTNNLQQDGFGGQFRFVF
ncbi:MAG: hypothetical protein SH809_02850 [Rhodothermales bacterium]|nr:hypothetical protein [Rhodothermales bacterium]